MMQPVLTTPRLVLRPFVPSDAPDVQRLAGVAEVADTTLNLPHPYLDGMAESWIATHDQAWHDGERATFAITTASDGLVGAISLMIAASHRRAEIGYWIGVPWWNRGFATEAAAAILALGFETLGLNRIQATHLTRNPASGRVMQKLGMRFEGVQKEYFLKKDRFEDVARYAMLRTDYVPAAPR